MDRNKHIWEGWTVGNFIDEVEPFFNQVVKSGFYNVGHNGFESRKELKKWVASNQPYYKKHIPDVYRYFLSKTDL